MDYGDPATAGLFGGRMGDILDEGWLKSMKELEWRRNIGDCGASLCTVCKKHNGGSQCLK